MNKLLKIVLIPVCILYALTPGRSGWEHTEAFYQEALVLGIMNAFLLSGIFYYFFGESQDTYMGTVSSMGFWLGVWTFIGGVYYPFVAQIFGKESEDAQQKASSEAFRRYNAEGLEMINSKNAYYELLEKDSQACKELVLEARRLLREGKEGQAAYAWMKDFMFIREESVRFEIDSEK